MDLDDIAISKSAKVAGEPSAVAFANVPTPWCASIPRDTQRQLLRFFLRVKDLSETEWLLLRHVWLGKPMAVFPYASRTATYEAWREVVRKVPEAASLARGTPLKGTVTAARPIAPQGRGDADLSRDLEGV